MSWKKAGGLALACLAAPALASPTTLSDAELVAYAARPYDHAAMMFKHVVLGVNHGQTVVADFPCSDLCPDYTTRIIHYDLEPGAPCAAAGGVTVTRRVPYSIAMIDKDFCVPKALAGR
jgi:hypothetical protein